MKQKILFLLIAVLSLVFLPASYDPAQAASGEKAPQKITVTGKIDYSDRFGGYYVEGENPPSQLFIVNPDKKRLDALKKDGKPVKIEGRLTVGADHLKIEKINGKKYP